MTEDRASPFYCPYCGDEDLRPHGTSHGEWECRACRRVFALSFRGILSASLIEDRTDAAGDARG
jgi:ribosomal protein L37AE/L43A